MSQTQSQSVGDFCNTPVAYTPKDSGRSDDSGEDIRDYLAGILDAGLDITVKITRPKKTDGGDAEPVKTFRTIVRLGDENLLKTVRKHFESSAMGVTTAKAGGVRAWAEFAGSNARQILKIVAKRGVANRDIARATYACLKGVVPFEDALSQIEAERNAVVETTSVERVVKARKPPVPKPSDTEGGAPAPPKAAETKPRIVSDISVTDVEVDRVVDMATDGWLGGFLDATAIVKPSVDAGINGKGKKRGRIVLNTHKFPRAFAVASGIKKIVGAGKVNAARPRLSFTTRKDIEALMKSDAAYRTLDFDMVD